MFKQKRKILILVLVFSLAIVSLGALIYGVIKQLNFNKIDFKSEIIKSPTVHNRENLDDDSSDELLGLDPKDLTFSVNEVLNFISINRNQYSYSYYFNLEYFKYNFIKKWLALIPIPTNSKLLFKVDNNQQPKKVDVIYGTKDYFKYHWFYRVKQ